MPKKLQTKAVVTVDANDLDEPEVDPIELLSDEQKECLEIGQALLAMSQEPDSIYDIKLGGAGGRVVIDCKVGNAQLVFGKSLVDALGKLSY